MWIIKLIFFKNLNKKQFNIVLISPSNNLYNNILYYIYKNNKYLHNYNFSLFINLYNNNYYVFNFISTIFFKFFYLNNQILYKQKTFYNIKNYLSPVKTYFNSHFFKIRTTNVFPLITINNLHLCYLQFSFYNFFFYSYPKTLYINYHKYNSFKKNFIFNRFIFIQSLFLTSIKSNYIINFSNYCKYNSTINKTNCISKNYKIKFIKINFNIHFFEKTIFFYKKYYLNGFLMKNKKLIIYIFFKKFKNFIDWNFFNHFFSIYSNNYNYFNNNLEYFIRFNKTYFNIYNNYYPIILINDIIKFHNFQKKKTITNSIMFNVFNMNFLENFFKNKFFIKSKKFNFKKINKDFFKSLIKKLINLSIKKKLPPFLTSKLISSLVKILVYSLYNKDLSPFFNWFLENLELINLYNHKIFLTFFKNLILNDLLKYFIILNINGFFLDVRGKVGVAGNSKKRHFCFTAGTMKYSFKKTKLDYKNDIVKTTTGCLGVTMFLSYN